MTSSEAPAVTRPLHEVYDRRIATKILAEFCHERRLRPIELEPGRHLLLSDDRQTEYTFSAEILSLENWVINEDSIRRVRDGRELPLDSVDLIIDLSSALGISDEALPAYLEEFINTLAISAHRADSRRIAADDLAVADFQTVERTLTEGHPCIVANAGRLGFSADDIAAYAPESADPFPLAWVAAWREHCDVSTISGVDYDELLRAELGEQTLDRFAATLRDLGCDPADYRYLPVHPWQWTEKIAKFYAREIVDRQIVHLGPSPDLYQPQQSIRSLFNADTPTRHYVKTALSIVNMGFTRGMSADYMRTTPLINDWVRSRLADDPYLAELNFTLLYEVAAIGYRNPTFAGITAPGSEYRKFMSALWRESPITRVAEHEQLASMASLLHIDHQRNPLVGAFIERSGLTAREWVARYLRTYLHPITYLLYQHELKFSPHGENLILVLDSGVPVRAILKDIGEEVCIFSQPDDLPAECHRALTDERADIRNLGVLSDVFDDYLRPLAAVLHAGGILDDAEFWEIVHASLTEFIAAHPQLGDRFAAWDLFAPTFPAVHLNGLQLANNQRMANAGESYASLTDGEHQLINPIAHHHRPHDV